MCTVSMIFDHYHDKWQRQTIPPAIPSIPWTPAFPTPEEIAEFRELLERAREYDREHDQPDCETAEKRERLKALADELGIEIEFV